MGSRSGNEVKVRGRWGQGNGDEVKVIGRWGQGVETRSR